MSDGVGYDVLVPLSTMYVIGDPGSRMALRIYTHVREDALQLFGFATPLEQALFERLISVSGIGPKLALSVLSGIEPAELSRAIRSSDIARLTRIPGVGRKTAERLVVELKDRLPDRRHHGAVRRPALKATTSATICCRRSRTSVISARPSRRRWTKCCGRRKIAPSSRCCAQRSNC